MDGGRVMGGKRKTRRLVVFFKQKTAYEVLRSVVGSEMCMRNRVNRSWMVVEEWLDSGRVRLDSGWIVVG